MLAPPGRFLTHHRDLTFFWFDQSEDDTDQGGFSSAVGSDQTDKIVLEHIKVDIFKHHIGFVTSPKVFD